MPNQRASDSHNTSNGFAVFKENNELLQLITGNDCPAFAQPILDYKTMSYFKFVASGKRLLKRCAVAVPACLFAVLTTPQATAQQSPMPLPTTLAENEAVAAPQGNTLGIVRVAGGVQQAAANQAEGDTRLQDPIFADVTERLRKAELRIQELQGHRDLELRQEQRTNEALRTLRERWDTAKDPSITTVDQQTNKPGESKSKDKKWYDRLSIRGYTQLRLNELLETEPGSTRPQYVSDRSIGDDQNFLIRRARLIISGDVSDRMYVYLQPDFATTTSGSADLTYFTQIRDWYADVYLDDDKVNRLRFGQSKVPYGWENLQSSSNRIALDRSDALNSAVRNERDLGIFYYWTPQPAQDFFKYVLDEGLKGSGNYGVFGMGVYNGQGGSFLEQNEHVHFVTRLTIPYKFDGGQCMEVGVQGYIGEYGVFGSAISPNGVGPAVVPAGTLTATRDIRDERIAGSFIWYPQPIGLQAEWNVGRGPGLNDAQTLVEDRALYGGYVQTMVKVDTQCHGTIFPYARWVLYDGGYKPERNAPFSKIDEWEFGAEWQINKQMEFTMAMLLTDRTNTTAISSANTLSYDQFDGSVMRFQFQFNY